MPMISSDILYSSASELAKRIQSKSLSPVELTKAYLDRSEKFGPRFNAYARLTPELALEQATAAEKEINRGHYRGPLHGMPYAAKDLLATRGIPTTWGAKPFENQVFDFDATVVENLRRAGAVLIGKAAMIELAGGMNYRFASASLEGAAKNPWNTSCWTCGSSSGSGAIVAAGLAAFAIGTETWGSIICPSAYCGISGLRPTFGRVSRYGAMALSYSMDKIGPMARSAEDCAHIFAVMAGHDIKDQSTLALDKAAFTYSPSAELSAKALRVGWLSNAWRQLDAHSERAIAAAERSIRKIFPGARNAALPEGPFEAAAGIIVGVEGAGAFRDLLRSGRVGQLTDPLGQINGYVNEQIAGADYLRALQVRALLQQKMELLFDGFDVLVAASQPLGANSLDANLESEISFPDPLGAIGNLCGLPALSIPCGFTDQNLPLGLQFVAKAGNDLGVIRAAKTFQQHTDWHRKHPKLS
jgi:aspartyl-tRNA(Asn)/glutamyl-tRNA(Gln) amidotransferase subunit A